MCALWLDFYGISCEFYNVAFPSLWPRDDTLARFRSTSQWHRVGPNSPGAPPYLLLFDRICCLLARARPLLSAMENTYQIVVVFIAISCSPPGNRIVVLHDHDLQSAVQHSEKRRPWIQTPPTHASSDLRRYLFSDIHVLYCGNLAERERGRV